MANKILFIDQFNKPGGGQSVLINLVLAAAKSGFEISLLIPSGNYIQSKLKDCDVKYCYISPLILANGKKKTSDIFNLVNHYFSIYKIIKKTVKNNDIVYTNGPRYFFLIIFFSFFFRRRYYYHFHTNPPKLARLMFFYLRKYVSLNYSVFTSEYLSSIVEEDSKIKSYVLTPSLTQGLSNNHFIDRYTRTEVNCTYNFICVGRIIPEKGQNLFIELASVLPQHNFYIVGEPEFDSFDYFEEIKNGSNKNVSFYGRTESIYETFNELNIHFSIVPSQWEEPFGMVAIESMSMSSITFVSNKGGLSEIAEKTGAVVFNNINELIKCVNETIGLHNDHLVSLANAQFTNTMKYYSFDNLCKEFDSIMKA